MKSIGMLRLAGVVVGAAVVFSPAALADDVSPAALADDFFPPGTVGPLVWPPVFTTDIDAGFFQYSEQANAYNVMDGDDVIGQFTNNRDYFTTTPFLVWTTFDKEVISDSTYAGLPDGATRQDLSINSLTLFGFQNLFSNEYFSNPAVGTSDYMSILGTRFPLWDFTYDAAGGSATESGGLGDLFGVDLSSLGDWFATDPGGLGDLFDLNGLLGLDPSALTSMFTAIDPGGLTDFAGLL